MRMTEEEFAALTGCKVEKKKKTNKHHNLKVYVTEEGVPFDDRELAEQFGKIALIFDSRKEYRRWEELKLLQRAGEISDLLRQVKWIIADATVYGDEKIREIAYKADFQYTRNGRTVVEDVKPFDEKSQKYMTTKDFAIKWKMLKQKYPGVLFELY